MMFGGVFFKVYSLLTCCKASPLNQQDVLAALIASMIHDYDHPGLNNNYHIKTQNYLATLYNDRSILENHHLAEVAPLLFFPRGTFGFLIALSLQFGDGSGGSPVDACCC